MNKKCLTPNIVYMATVTTRTNSQGNDSANDTCNDTPINGTPINDTTHNNPQNQTIETKFYIGSTENFKQRYNNHKKSFNNKAYSNETSLSKYIWQLKDSNKQFTIAWKIIKITSGYNNVSKNCSLCLSEKYSICLFKDKGNLLNKRSELISKCRHSNKHLLKYHA